MSLTSQQKLLNFINIHEFSDFMEQYECDDEVRNDFTKHNYYDMLMAVFNNKNFVNNYITNKINEQYGIPNLQEEKQLQYVTATYYVEECFKVPRNIDLNDKSQVKEYYVKFDKLYINLTNGKKIEVDNDGWINNYDYKYPIDIELHNNENFDEDDFKEVNIEPEPIVTKVRRVNINLQNRKKTDEDGIYLLDQDNNIYNANTKEEIGKVIDNKIIFN